MLVGDTNVVVKDKKNGNIWLATLSRLLQFKYYESFTILNIHGEWVEFVISEHEEQQVYILNQKFYCAKKSKWPIFQGGGFDGGMDRFPTIMFLDEIDLSHNNCCDGIYNYYYNNNNKFEFIKSIEETNIKKMMYSVWTNSKLNTYLTEFGYAA